MKANDYKKKYNRIQINNGFIKEICWYISDWDVLGNRMLDRQDINIIFKDYKGEYWTLKIHKLRNSDFEPRCLIKYLQSKKVPRINYEMKWKAASKCLFITM